VAAIALAAEFAPDARVPPQILADFFIQVNAPADGLVALGGTAGSWTNNPTSFQRQRFGPSSQ